MKKLLCFLLFLSVAAGLCGCSASRQKNVILFNHEPITKENLLQNATQFDINKRIYYVFMTEDKLSSDFIRVRVMKREEKADFVQSKLAYSNDYRLYKDQIYYYNDYIVMHEAGYYCMVVYAKNRLDIPLASADFQVKN